MADNSNSSRIYQQIESTAEHFNPGVYSEVLTQLSNFELVDDALATQFIPLSTAQNATDARMHLFAIGLIPPAAEITSRQLDRSASVANNLTGTNADAITVEGKVQEATARSASNNNGPKSTSDPNFWPQYVVMCNRLGVQPEELAKVINGESGFNPSAKATSKRDGVIQAKGLNALTHDTARGMGMTEEEWVNYESSSATSQLKWVEKYFSVGDRARGKTGEELYITNFHPASFRNPNGSLYDKNIPSQKRSYEENAWLDKDRKGYITEEDTIKALVKPLPPGKIKAIQDAQKLVGMNVTEKLRPVEPDVPPTQAFQASGAKDANLAQQQSAQTSRSSLNSTILSNKLRYAQVLMAANINAAIQRMAALPPLRMLVNPQSLQINNEKIISDGNRSRRGHIVEQWGDGQDTLEVSGKIGAFYCGDVAGFNDDLTEGGPGLTRTARQYSAAYQNFLSLYQIYRNNAGIYISDSGDSTQARTNLAMSGSIYIYYDRTLYIGSFDSFSVTETDASPFSLEYSFQFTVRATFLLDQVPDPRFTYGLTPLNSNKLGNNSTTIQLEREPVLRPDQTVPASPAVQAEFEKKLIATTDTTDGITAGVTDAEIKAAIAANITKKASK